MHSLIEETRLLNIFLLFIVAGFSSSKQYCLNLNSYRSVHFRIVCFFIKPLLCNSIHKIIDWLNPSCPDPGRREEINWIFIFALSYIPIGVMKALKTSMKPFEAPQRNMKIKFKSICPRSGWEGLSLKYFVGWMRIHRRDLMRMHKI